MSKYKLKTKKNNGSVTKFINSLDDITKKKDSMDINRIMREITGKRPKMWGESIIGYGSYRYKSKSGIEGEWPRIGFSPRKQNISIYIMPGVKNYPDLLKKIGPHKTGSSCLYIKKLEEIHIPTLKKIIKKGYKDMDKHYPQ